MQHRSVWQNRNVVIHSLKSQRMKVICDTVRQKFHPGEIISGISNWKVYMLNKLERKFGRFAIKGLMKYVTALYVLGFIISFISPGFYEEYLMLDIDKLLSGQVWRVLTFIIQPPSENIILEIFSLYIYYIIGSTLESAWGSFRFNLYYFAGIIFTGIATVAVYIYTSSIGFGISLPIGLDNLNMSLFLAFAATFPNMQFLFMFFLPIKAKVLGFVYAGLMAYDIIDAFRMGKELGIICLISVGISLLNFVIFFFIYKKNKFVAGANREWRQMRKAHEGAAKRERDITGRDGNIVYPWGGNPNISRHKCCVCGRTEKDDPDLEFRFCTKCNGNYEYCSDHIYTHEHRTE